MIVDLHSHSSASDGALSPEDLLARAQHQEVDMFAITDHDTIDGYLAVRELPTQPGAPVLIAGVEMSCVWGKHTVHIVGLNINAECQQLIDGLALLSQSRRHRARLIADRLASLGYHGGYEYVLELTQGSQIGRPHFAQFLVDHGHVQSVNIAFKRYLGAGKAGDINAIWPSVAQVVKWITAGGGIAVLAHPLHYKMTATKLRALLSDFKAAGGQAMEVVTGAQIGQNTDYLSTLAERFQLLASVGSDFHQPQVWSELGKVGKLPARCQPVWSAWQ